MSTRRSTRLSTAAAPATVPPILNGELSDAFDGELSELSDSDAEMAIESRRDEFKDTGELEEEDDEWSEDGRPAKRRKTAGGKARSTRAPKATSSTSALKTKPAARSRFQGRLKNIMSMPLDVLFEIFSALRPTDLLALARTSKALRDVTMNRKHIGVWKSARVNIPGIATPEPPAGMSEPAWAHLLYGGSGCYSCRAKNVQRIDFGLQRRACTNCKKDQLVWSSRFEKLCDGLDPALMDLVGYTNVGGHSHGHASNSRYYWKQDLVDMEMQLAKLRKGPDGLTALREFRAKRLVQVDALMQSVRTLDRWASDRDTQAKEEQRSIQDKNYESVTARFVAAGYDNRDIPSLYELRNSISSKQELTDATWKRLQLKIEPSVISCRDKRLEREEKTRVERRSRRATWLYRDFLYTLVPVQWRYLPTPQHLMDTGCRDLPSFRALVEMKAEPVQAQWDEAATKLPIELSAHLVSQLVILQQAMPDLTDVPQSFDFALASDGSDSFALDALAARFSLLDLARAVFMRGERDWTTGCDNPHAWDLMSALVFGSRPVLSPQGFTAVCAVARVVGKNFTSVTTTEMDRVAGDTWFRCTCSDKPGAPWNVFLGWRGFVDHVIRKVSDDSNHQPILVSAGDAPRTPKRTDMTGHRQWSCSHCNDYCVQPVTYSWGAGMPQDIETFVQSRHGVMNFALGQRADLIQHNKDKHGIQEPVEHLDYFYYAVPGATRPITSVTIARRKPNTAASASTAVSKTTAKIPPTGGFKCLHCIKPGPNGRGRVFTVEAGVRSHIVAKHRDVIGSKTEQTLVLATDFALAAS
ncbi:hypothetical protein PENSPDRAFT_620016 [Peniophora sp. CONT]|nr:hypothetical protein PENSPDRAFT_620016 [Peniophora sp. CONT]